MKKVRRLKKIAIFFMMLLVIESFSACSKSDSVTGTMDVISNIDMESVTTDDEFTSFTVTADGDTIHFQGMNIEVTEEGILMKTGAVLGSLDYIGVIREVTVEGNAPGCWLEFGLAYADSASVNGVKELEIGFPNMIELTGESVQNISSFDSGFLVLGAEGNAGDILLTKLTFAYDSTEKQIFYSDLKENSENARLLANFSPNWDTAGVIDELKLAEMKMAEPGAITSDIIAGIDYESISQSGDSTFFSSQMSDGEILRFEGKNITISEEGIEIRPDSELTSLDAVGKIYLYSSGIKDAENYAAAEEKDGSVYYNDVLAVGYGYTYSADKTSVDRAEEVHTYAYASLSPMDWSNGASISLTYLEPNFIYVSGSTYNQNSFILTSLSVGYNPSEKVTAVRKVKFEEGFTTDYLEGEMYNQNIETAADASTGSYDFYLILEPDTEYADFNDPTRSIYFVPEQFYEVGDLKDAGGTILDKSTTHVYEGTTLDIFVGDYAVALELGVLEQYKGASTMNDLVPYAFPEALGVNHTLVVPVVWSDQTEEATEKNLTTYKKALGRVEDSQGKITDYSDTNDSKYSLSEYFDIASYGKFEVNCFLTDWYYIDKTFADYEYSAPDKEYADAILEWVKETYPELDWSLYDQDGNGYIDSMILINAGIPADENTFTTISYGGAIHYRESYYGDYAGTQDDPNVNCFVTINQRCLADDFGNVLIHEFSHNFGIIDYYDVNYSGINAVGGYDMQSDNVGDWNAYSKLAVGWMDPQVVEGLSSGESVELTIGSMALQDDVIIIPAAGTEYEGPFSEYIMIDLFSDDGVNTYDAKTYGLEDTTGVRISHVNAAMEKRTMEIESKVNKGQADVYDIGTIHFSNAYVNDGRGFYNIEVIQSGKTNTFTNLDNEITKLTSEDLFYAGDVFTVEAYSEFFNKGLMDDGSAFGYSISIVSIGTNEDGTPNATIKITAK